MGRLHLVSSSAVASLRISPRLLRRLAWNVVPAAFVVVVLWQAMTGEDGIMNRHQHKQRLISLEQELVALERSNEALEAQIAALRDNPAALRRAAAEELHVAMPGSTIYRFENPTGLDSESARTE